MVAANKFRHAMAGLTESIAFSQNGAVGEVARGNAGVALVNFSSDKQKASLPCPLPDGEYTDTVHGTSFKVAKGNLSGTLAPLATYILYAK